MMKRTKFPYKYQKEQACICPDCRKEVFKWYRMLLNKIANSGNLPLAEKLVDELPFPLPDTLEAQHRFGNDHKKCIREYGHKKYAGFTFYNEHHDLNDIEPEEPEEFEEEDWES